MTLIIRHLPVGEMSKCKGKNMLLEGKRGKCELASWETSGASFVCVAGGPLPECLSLLPRFLIGPLPQKIPKCPLFPLEWIK